MTLPEHLPQAQSRWELLACQQTASLHPPSPGSNCPHPHYNSIVSSFSLQYLPSYLVYMYSPLALLDLAGIDESWQKSAGVLKPQEGTRP